MVDTQVSTGEFDLEHAVRYSEMKYLRGGSMELGAANASKDFSTVLAVEAMIWGSSDHDVAVAVVVTAAAGTEFSGVDSGTLVDDLNGVVYSEEYCRVEVEGGWREKEKREGSISARRMRRRYILGKWEGREGGNAWERSGEWKEEGREGSVLEADLGQAVRR
jgi:hypothetical protein